MKKTRHKPERCDWPSMQKSSYTAKDREGSFKVILLTNQKKYNKNSIIKKIKKSPITTKRFTTLAPDKNFLNTPASLKSHPAEWHVLWPGTVHFFCVFYYILAVHFFSTQQVNLPHFLFAFISPYYRIKSVHRCWKFWHLYAVTVPCCWTGFRYAYLSIAFLEAGMPVLQKYIEINYLDQLSRSTDISRIDISVKI